MNPATRGVKLTYDDFVHFPDDGLRHELIDGIHYVTPSPNITHQKLVGRLYLAIGSWLQTHPVGEVFLSLLDVVLSQFDVVEPDLLYVSHQRASSILTAANIRGTPELVIEIGSPGTRKRDETIKRELYERAGVHEYWFVDPDRKVVRVYRLDGSRFEEPIELTSERREVLTTPLIAGLELKLTEIFQ